MKRSRSKSPKVKQRSKMYSDHDTLYIKNIPKYWDFERTRKFIIDSSKSKAVVEGIKVILVLKMNRDLGSCLVKFYNSFSCNLAHTELSDIFCEGRKLDVSFDTENLYHYENKLFRQEIFKRNISRKQSQNMHMLPQHTDNKDSPMQRSFHSKPIDKPQQNEPVVEEYETYGLSKSFLQALNIKLPLFNKIFVGNLDPTIDEAKLREVFTLAGQVIQVFLINKDYNKSIAKIEFDHPVEAVQAISMFNNQELYGKLMVVQMDLSGNLYKNLPKGLSGFGPGLGSNGEPLRGVRTHIEMRPLKNLLMQQEIKVKGKNEVNIEDQHLNANQGQRDTNIQNPFNPVPVVNPLNPVIQQNPLFNLSGMVNPQGFQLLQNLFQPNTMANENNMAFASMQNQYLQMQGNVLPNTGGSTSLGVGVSNPALGGGGGRPNNVSNFQSRLNIDFNNQGKLNYDNKRNIDDVDNKDKRWWDQENNDNSQPGSDLLIFTNLPSSVTFQALSDKMREVGDVKFVEITGSGRALVRFRHPKDAERCVSMFHESKVDGKIIHVRSF